jgi:hypothetical protein
MTRSFATLALPAPDADAVRRRFVAARVDPALVRQMPQALEVKDFDDGPAYEGYLWDFLEGKRVVTEPEIWGAVAGAERLYAMSDLHSAERVRLPEGFPRGTVLRASAEVLRAGLAYLPEDLYLFDDSFTWAAALTHEDVDGTRFCLWSGREWKFHSAPAELV